MAGRTVMARAMMGRTVAGRTVTGRTVMGRTVTVAGGTVAGRATTGRTVADRAVMSQTAGDRAADRVAVSQATGERAAAGPVTADAGRPAILRPLTTGLGMTPMAPETRTRPATWILAMEDPVRRGRAGGPRRTAPRASRARSSRCLRLGLPYRCRVPSPHQAVPA